MTQRIVRHRLTTLTVTAAAATLLLDRTAALAAELMSQCDASYYYDVSTGQCCHCDAACLQRENGTVVAFLEDQCFALCPGFVTPPRTPHRPDHHPQPAVTLSSFPDEAAAVVVVMVVLVLVVLVVALTSLWRCRVAAAVKDCCHPHSVLRGGPSATLGSCVITFGNLRQSSDVTVNDSSYVRLTDPSEEVELVERVTTV